MLADKVKKMYFWLSSQDNIDKTKSEIINLINRELEPDEIDYYSECMIKINAYRSIYARNLKRRKEDITDNRHVEFEITKKSE